MVELTYICPVLCSGNRTSEFTVNDDLTKLCKIICIESISHSLLYLINLSLIAKNIRICSKELLLIERLAEFLLTLLYILGNLILKFTDVILDENVCAISLLRILVVDKRVVESTDMA